mmetsp:Transcript_1519/g.2083  ORF Transcript_1519/g.2083 Transcript_1519/m.2083 type:complete len:177 (-) Transcript_1519:251-781(-)|eukprot:CAMPEP_0185596400 /NCGR_PEP_ID=MMETSP0434-20130131/80736_1 /TAXON_ID=626734 ORGANISM="Favella taraikaensis, Strain Fe Narragansett Bay" /NCGR_SAMPLE_ID=MMETSP0434 /ASSEMBLY_ACC=CAM_ASM_000379 /LENGTH=176 /DNA_ID=CAMNT_0028224899 /DNA_START=122 /DNA_END=652 /DNA_ORIENTATION=-
MEKPESIKSESALAPKSSSMKIAREQVLLLEAEKARKSAGRHSGKNDHRQPQSMKERTKACLTEPDDNEDDDDILNLDLISKKKERERKKQKLQSKPHQKLPPQSKQERQKLYEASNLTASFEKKRSEIYQKHRPPDDMPDIAERNSVSELASFVNRSLSDESRKLKASIVSQKSY